MTTGHIKTLSHRNMARKGNFGERLALLALRSQFPEYLWLNLNGEHARAPIDLVACDPKSGEPILAIEVKGTDFQGTSPGITMRKAAIARKVLWCKEHKDPVPLVLCIDWRTGQSVIQYGFKCYHASEMEPIENVTIEMLLARRVM